MSADNVYGGNLVAQFNSEQLATFRSMLGYANGSNIPGKTANVGGSLAGAAAGGTTGAISGLSATSPRACSSIVVALSKLDVWSMAGSENGGGPGVRLRGRRSSTAKLKRRTR
jgi:hypothetical protein